MDRYRETPEVDAQTGLNWKQELPASMSVEVASNFIKSRLIDDLSDLTFDKSKVDQVVANVVKQSMNKDGSVNKVQLLGHYSMLQMRLSQASV